MRILADLHHADLYKSLLLLFEKRLGHEVYRPVGMDWFDLGYWRYLFPAKETAWQYLNPAGYPGLKQATLGRVTSGAFDILLSSTPPMFDAFESLIQDHLLHDSIKHIFQSGNDWPMPASCENFLNSTLVGTPPAGTANVVHYHQEFSLEDYQPTPSYDPRLVSSFMHYMPGRPVFEDVEKCLPHWGFRMFGANGRDGQPADLPSAMRSTGYLWHPKRVEAYGYNVHYAAACGKPVIGFVRANKHHTCGAFLTKQTSLDFEDYATAGELASALLRFNETYPERSEAMVKLFRKAVDFDAEEKAIRVFMENLR